MNEDTNKPSEVNSTDATNLENNLFSVEENEALRVYFERQGEELLNCWKNNLGSSDDLSHYLLRQLEHMKKFCTRMELPWDEFIPILYKALALYFIHSPEPNMRKRALFLTTEMMNTFVFLMQNGTFISKMSCFYHQQICLLKKWLDENKEELSSNTTGEHKPVTGEANIEK